MTVDDVIQGLEPKTKFPKFRVGDTVRVHVRIVEGEKERIQIFEGVVMKRRRAGSGSSFTVRKVSYGVGVERVFAMRSPSIEKIEVVQHGRVRRGRLFYLRKRKGKDSAIREQIVTETEEEQSEETETESPDVNVNSLAGKEAAQPVAS